MPLNAYHAYDEIARRRAEAQYIRQMAAARTRQGAGATAQPAPMGGSGGGNPVDLLSPAKDPWGSTTIPKPRYANPGEMKQYEGQLQRRQQQSALGHNLVKAAPQGKARMMAITQNTPDTPERTAWDADVAKDVMRRQDNVQMLRNRGLNGPPVPTNYAQQYGVEQHTPATLGKQDLHVREVNAPVIDPAMAEAERQARMQARATRLDTQATLRQNNLPQGLAEQSIAAQQDMERTRGDAYVQGQRWGATGQIGAAREQAQGQVGASRNEARGNVRASREQARGQVGAAEHIAEGQRYRNEREQAGGEQANYTRVLGEMYERGNEYINAMRDPLLSDQQRNNIGIKLDELDKEILATKQRMGMSERPAAPAEQQQGAVQPGVNAPPMPAPQQGTGSLNATPAPAAAEPTDDRNLSNWQEVHESQIPPGTREEDIIRDGGKVYLSKRVSPVTHEAAGGYEGYADFMAH
jgi:hypothetical protein